MEVILATIPTSSMLIMGYGTIKVKNHIQYKKYKKSIYNYIRKAIKSLDFEDILVGFEKLKDFDTKNKDEFGEQKRTLWEKFINKKRLPKCEKTEKLFNLPKDIIDDLQKLKQHFKKELRKDDLKNNLQRIEEEEKKENETLVDLKKKLSKIKIKQLAENNTNRKILDDMNLTKVIENLHSDYEELFVKTFENENDLTNMIQRAAKKQMILKRMELINGKKIEKNLRSC